MDTAPAARFALIIDLLCRAVAARAAEGAFAKVRAALAGPALVLLLWTRLRRAAARLQALAAATSPAPSRPRPHRAARPPRPRADLPRRRGWLLRPVPEAAGFAAQLRHLLDDPAMQALIEADPRAGRILRPLCRDLGIGPPPCLRLPRRPRTPAAAPLAGNDADPGHDRAAPIATVPRPRRLPRRYLPPRPPPRGTAPRAPPSPA